MLMRVKEGAELDGLALPMLRALYLIALVLRERGHTTFTVTSGVRTPEADFSLHPSGRALDIRRWTLTYPAAAAEEISAILGPDYDVVLEEDHLHIEHDPRTRPAGFMEA